MEMQRNKYDRRRTKQKKKSKTDTETGQRVARLQAAGGQSTATRHVDTAAQRVVVGCRKKKTRTVFSRAHNTTRVHI